MTGRLASEQLLDLELGARQLAGALERARLAVEMHWDTAPERLAQAHTIARELERQIAACLGGTGDAA